MYISSLNNPRGSMVLEYLPTLGLFGKLHHGVNVGVHIPAPWILREYISMCYVFFSDIYHWFSQVLAVAVWAAVLPSLNFALNFAGFAGAVSRWQAMGLMGMNIS